jgi:hypothetical protein
MKIPLRLLLAATLCAPAYAADPHWWHNVTAIVDALK